MKCLSSCFFLLQPLLWVHQLPGFYIVNVCLSNIKHDVLVLNWRLVHHIVVSILQIMDSKWGLNSIPLGGITNLVISHITKQLSTISACSFLQTETVGWVTPQRWCGLHCVAVKMFIMFWTAFSVCCLYPHTRFF